MHNYNNINKLSNESVVDVCTINENNMSVHNISMNAVLSSALNLDSIYKYFSNCIYKPKDFKCIRIDVPVSKETIDKYTKYIKQKQEKVERKKRKRLDTENESSNILTNKSHCDISINIKTEKEKEKEKQNEKEKETENEKEKETLKDELKPKIRCIESKIEQQLSPLKDINWNSQNKKGIVYYEDMLKLKESFDTKTITDDNVVLELLNEIDSTDIDFSENEKIIINVSLFANGKLICTGNNSVEACKIAMKKIENKLKEHHVKNIKLRKVTITNILAVYNAGFSIVLPLLAQYYKNVDYDPNVFPACKVKIALENNSDKSNKAAENQGKDTELAWASNSKETGSDSSTHDIISASIFSTGNITLTGAKTYENLKRTIQILLPYLLKCRSQHHSNNIDE